jgi:serine/threonine protein kinase
MSSRAETRATTEKQLVVHDYTIGHEIARGHYGQIRLAVHRPHGIPFAVKMMAKRELALSRHGKSVLFNETILAPLFNHRSIIEIQEIADSPSYIFQFMQLADHGDLLTRLRAAPLDPTLILHVINSLLSAVEYLHSHGICHRDIRLENILLTRSAGVKLSDFRLAEIAFDGIVEGRCGTFEYSAPEVIRNSVCNGFKADMWSIGVVIYALFARQLPFKDVKESFDFERSAIDFTVIPTEFQPLVEQLLLLDADARPDATDARAFPALKACDSRIKPPLSALSSDLDLSGSTEIISRMSQVLHIEFGRVMAILHERRLSIEKLLFVLIRNRGSTAADPLFMAASRSRSGADRSPIMMKAAFERPSSEVFWQMHSILMGQRCSVSSPLTRDPLIMNTRDPNDSRINFNCLDEGDSRHALLTLIVHKDNKGLAGMIMAKMHSVFPPTA